MTTRKKALIIVLATTLGTATLSLLAFHQTLYGLFSQKYFTWEEDAFNGRLLSELQSSLANQGRDLMPVDAESFFAITDRTLEPNQRAMRFTKGKAYRWFGCGTAINVGYVVSEKQDGIEKIVAIIRARSVDSL